jgi:hypothetical protein
MASTDLKITVTFEAVQDSPELQELLRQIIREELIKAIETMKVEQENVSND